MSWNLQRINLREKNVLCYKAAPFELQLCWIFLPVSLVVSAPILVVAEAVCFLQLWRTVTAGEDYAYWIDRDFKPGGGLEPRVSNWAQTRLPARCRNPALRSWAPGRHRMVDPVCIQGREHPHFQINSSYQITLNHQVQHGIGQKAGDPSLLYLPILAGSRTSLSLP
jgi:hypothetical protein